LFEVSLSLDAEVSTVAVTVPTVVGLPETLQVTVWPPGTSAGCDHAVELGLMVQPVTETPAGKLVTPQAACVAVTAEVVLVQLNVPA
jgi:hypothetical protein